MKQNNHIDISIGNLIVYAKKIFIDLENKEIEIRLEYNTKNIGFLKSLDKKDKSKPFTIKFEKIKIPYKWMVSLTSIMHGKEVRIEFWEKSKFNLI